VSGVKGTLSSASQVIASGLGTSINGLSAPATAALGTDTIERNSSKLGMGGSENYIPLAGTTLRPMNSGANQAASSGSSLSVTKEAPSVHINVSIAQASPAEAKKLADMVKSYLEDDMMISNMGRR
jgi:hypothetical protein